MGTLQLGFDVGGEEVKRDRDREVAGWIESGRDTPSGWIGNRVISPDAVFEERIEAIAVVVGVGIAGEGD